MGRELTTTMMKTVYKKMPRKRNFHTLAEKYFPIPVGFMVMQQYSVSEAAFEKNIYPFAKHRKSFV